MKLLVLIVGLMASASSFAGWYSGKIEMIAVGYDGRTISIAQENSTRNDCTCYPTWPNRYCMDRSRESFSEEYALLLSAKARGASVALHIDETTCQIRAMYEN